MPCSMTPASWPRSCGASTAGSAVPGAHRQLSPTHVSEAPPWPGLRDPGQGGCRLALLAALLPDPPGGRRPHPTTLMKLTRRFGTSTIDDLNATLLEAVVEKKVLRSRRLRVDTTVVEADVRYPTDSGLCAHAVSRLTRAVKAVKSTGLAVGTRFRPRVKEAGEAVRRMSHTLGRVRGRAAVDRITGELHQLASACAVEAQQVLKRAGRATGSRALKGKLAVARLTEEIRRAEIVIGQTTRRLAGETTISDRVISLADLDARPLLTGH